MTPAFVRIAHRGGGSLAPENSVEGIERSIALGIEMVEVDVRRSRDGHLVLGHDDVLHDAGRTISASTLAELRRARPQTALLDEALEACGRRARLNIDIKDAGAVEAILDAVRRHDATERCIVSSLEMRPLAEVAARAPSLQRFFSYPPDRGGASRKPWLTPVVNAVVAGMRVTLPRRLAGMLAAVPGTNATIYEKLLTPALMRRARALGILLYTWTIDDAARMREAVTLGVDGITSNRPDLLASLSAGAPAQLTSATNS
ncbi:MAG: glycerophosphodiester phosphodiesterase [Chloroflexi bacterium]|nr:glycerophosphodiester phosphodiesterase [Chloroflexota bacterium]